MKLLALGMQPALPRGTASATASHMSAQCSTLLITLAVDSTVYSANITGATPLVSLHLFFQNSPVDWTVLTGNGNIAKNR
jgi:hypothetical protein